MPLPKTKRTVTVDIGLDPSISGYGGFDQWTLDDMTNEEMDRFFAALDNLCQMHRPDCWTGAQ